MRRLSGLGFVLLALSCGSSGDGGSTDEPPLPEGPFEIVADVPAGRGFQVASDGKGYLVAFTAIGARDRSDVFAVRLSATGDVLDEVPIAVSDASSDDWIAADTADYGEPGVGFDGTDYGVAFHGAGRAAENRDAPVQEVSFVVVGRDGRRRGSPAILTTEFSFSTAFSALRPPIAVAGVGAGFVTVYTRFGGGVSVPASHNEWRFFPDFDSTPAAGVPMQETEPLLRNQRWPGVAGGADGAFVAWVDSGAYVDPPRVTAEVRGAHTDRGHRGGDRFTLVQEPLDSLPPLGNDATLLRTAVASTGEDYLVAWMFPTSPEESGPTVLRGVRYRRADGAPPAEAVFSIAGEAGDRVLVGAAFARDRFLVVWTEGRAAHGAWVSREGEASPPFVIDPGPVDSEAALATDGDHLLVLLARPTNGDRVAIEGVFVQ